jgi:superfamily II DNA or RNA helicase
MLMSPDIDLRPPHGVALRLVFDRGTVLLRGLDREQAELLQVDAVPGLLWDQRVAAYRCPAHLHGAACAALRELGVVLTDAVLERRASSVITARSPALRPYQTDALAAWQLAGRRGLLVLPTGSGKTLLGLAALADVARPTLILVPTRVLLEQWATRLAAVYDGPVGLFGDGSRNVEDVTVATFESAFRHADEFGNRFALLVVDEAHHLGSGCHAEALEMCTGTARMGLTATPPEEPGAAARLAALIGPVVCHYSVGQLSGRHLAPFECIRLPVELSNEERSAYDRGRALFQAMYRRFRRERQGASWRDFVLAAGASGEGRQALAGFHESRRVVAMAGAKLRLAEQILDRHRGEPSLIFTADNRVAYALARRLLVPALTCDIGRSERQDVLAALRAGKVRAVVSARVLNEGVDLPDARVGIILGGAQGGREHVQRVGRLLRPGEGKQALVYELVASATFEMEHARRRQRYLVD